MRATSIEQVITVLDDMREVAIISKFAVGGAFAAILHDEPISTVDLDIFFILTKGGDETILSLAEIYDYAREKGFEFDHEFINIHGWLVQFVESSRNNLWLEAIESASPIRVGNREIRLIDPEHLAAMWLLAGRAKDYQKISMFIESGLIDTTKFLNLLKKEAVFVHINLSI